MAARRKPIAKPIEKPESIEEVIEPIIEEKPEKIEVKHEDHDLRYHLMIPVKMYERMRNIGNDEYWLRIIDNHIEVMMNRYHQ